MSRTQAIKCAFEISFLLVVSRPAGSFNYSKLYLIHMKTHVPDSLSFWGKMVKLRGNP